MSPDAVRSPTLNRQPLTLGLDIGGANIKAATSDGRAVSAAFPLWKSPERLGDELQAITDQLPDCPRLGITITGELADCFATKAEGVSRILDAVESLAQDKPIGVWSTEGRFLSIQAARTLWSLVAAANWHAQATWAGRLAPQGTALLIDIGSTTTDIIPLTNGRPCAQGSSDLGRLLNGELVYTGVRRTPLCALTTSVPLRGTSCPLAAELFATTLDLYLIAGRIASSTHDCDTADGRPATVERAYDRVARMLCCDRTELTIDELQSISQELINQQLQIIRAAIDRALPHPLLPVTAVILSGSGAFLAREVIDAIPSLLPARRIELDAELSADLAEAACAHAVAMLLAETTPKGLPDR